MRERTFKTLSTDLGTAYPGVATKQVESQWYAVVRKRLDGSSYEEYYLIAPSQTMILEQIKVLLRSGRKR